MPRIDFHELSSESNLVSDICIIGSGPAGATIARELERSGLQVILLESGGIERQPLADALNEIESIGWPRVLDQWLVCNRIVGGTSHTWAGRCSPFDEIDFARRGWVAHSGWPFDLDHMRPYLERTPTYLGPGAGADYADDRFWSLAGRLAPKPVLNEELLCPFFWQFSRAHENRYDNVRFGPELVANLPANVRLITKATVIQLDLNSSGRAIESVEVAALNGSRHTVRAPTVALCAAASRMPGCCSPRPRSRSGIGNQRDLVGRFLWTIREPSSAPLQFSTASEILKRFGFYHVKCGQNNYRFRHGFRVSPAIQRKERLLNCSAWPNEEVLKDDPWKALKRILRGKSRAVADLRAIVSNADALLQGAADLFVRRSGLTPRWARLFPP